MGLGAGARTKYCCLKPLSLLVMAIRSAGVLECRLRRPQRRGRSEPHSRGQQDTTVLLSSSPDIRVRTALQAFTLHGVDLEARCLQGWNQPMGEVFVEL